MATDFQTYKTSINVCANIGRSV